MIHNLIGLTIKNDHIYKLHTPGSRSFINPLKGSNIYIGEWASDILFSFSFLQNTRIRSGLSMENAQMQIVEKNCSTVCTKNLWKLGECKTVIRIKKNRYKWSLRDWILNGLNTLPPQYNLLFFNRQNYY